MNVRSDMISMPAPPKVLWDAPVGPQLWRIARDWILRGELLPGTRLSEVDIANLFGVSRQPVREAFIKLSEEALLEIRPQRGTYVSRISIAAVTSARFVREAVEADIVRLVAKTPEQSLLDELEGLLAAQEEVLEGPEPQKFLALDEQFHRRLAEAAGQSQAWEILQPLKTQMDRMRYLNARHFSRAQLLEQHSQIVEAIRAENPGSAEDAMRNHLRQLLDDLPVIAKALPHFFENGGAELMG
ncbi:GntR family transcriptional regulator [Rhizobium halophilum]|uniref:GntR family transcriptional regulator n=1 Tax=Rhizobium halophilum TaxID=2846852 RepID=UPI001EFC35AB|nr:GntR family transcriptional regulator [Rhizobium halophilum]MCF6370355.1 GntR family transcriptional regulator [Rhizobium halophilum]